MVYRDLFNVDEWKTLQFGHFWVFEAVASADNKIDTEEKIALEDIMKSGDKIANPLMREIMLGLEFNIDKINAEFKTDHRKYTEGLKEIKALLDKSGIDRGVILGFMKTLLAIGVFIGQASGRWFSSKFSKEEIEVVKNIGLILGVSEEEIQSPPYLNEIIESFS